MQRSEQLLMTHASSTRSLPAGVHVADIAESCRYGALAYLNGVLAAWGKPELAAWLGGPYRNVTRFAREALDVESTAPSLAAGPSPVARKLAPHAIERVMRESHVEVTGTLRTLAEPDGGVSFAFHALGGVLVSRCRDDRGDFGWIPVAPMRMRLADRVLSLIAVDYLARPESYEEALAICSTCKVIAFDGAARARSLCRVHAGSGIRFKEAGTGAPGGDAERVSVLPETLRGAG
jgi:hypothetical protein